MNELDDLFQLLQNFTTPEFEKLPEIDLYMDQVLTYIKKHLPPFNDQDKDILTASMINNYVKDSVIQNPVDKKYNKEAIASLIMIANLKRVLPINDIKSLLANPNHIESLYKVYQTHLDDAIKLLLEKEKDLAVSDMSLNEVALGLTIDAAVKAYFAHMLLAKNAKPVIKEKKKKEAKDKEKNVQE